MKNLNKETIKAIRIVRGFNPDLRVKLTAINRDALWAWIRENRFGIFGLDFFPADPLPTSAEWDRFEKAIDHAVGQVINGR